ncbi:MAG: hypothetical protein QOH95_2491 [Gaiellaceae bacterium]|jgi:hypothetical protein|nr:hypothetical protein [Gaiellaceae bacterium]
MRIGFFSLLGGLIIVSGALVASGSARAHRSSIQVLLHANDRFDVTGAGVACRVVPKPAPLSNRLICFVETKPGSYKARRGTYAVEFAESGIAAGRVGSPKPVYVRPEKPPAGASAGSGQAKAPVSGAPIHLVRKADRTFVAGTNIVCRPWKQSPQGVLCVLLARDGRVPDGTYLAWVSARDVVVAREQNRRSVIVLRRSN